MTIIEYLFHKFETVDTKTIEQLTSIDLSKINLLEEITNDFKEKINNMEEA